MELGLLSKVTAEVKGRIRNRQLSWHWEDSFSLICIFRTFLSSHLLVLRLATVLYVRHAFIIQACFWIFLNLYFNEETKLFYTCNVKLLLQAFNNQTAEKVTVLVKRLKIRFSDSFPSHWISYRFENTVQPFSMSQFGRVFQHRI